MTIRTYFLVSLYIFLTNLALAGPVPNKSKAFLTVKAHHGQGVYGLLRSYKLLDKPDNLSLFYQINDLSKDEALVKNHKYKLPVTVHDFDGKSIRSSIGLKDIEKAKQIENYNKSVAKSDVKKRSFKKDKKIWVPVVITDNYELIKTESNSARANKFTKKTAHEIHNRESRKEIVEATLSSTEKETVADRKLTEEESIDAAEEKIERSSSNSNFATKVSSKSLNVPLFGNKYETVPMISNDLAEQVFYIVPGHGGPDPGAIAKNVDGNHTICEDEYAYDVSLRLAKDLIEKGATVYVIVQDKENGIRDEKYLECDCNEKCINGCSLPLNQKKRLKQGITYVNKLYAKHKKKGIKKQWMVTIHLDAQSEESRRDVFFYYQSESETSKNKALDIQKVFEEKYQTYRKNQEYSGTVSSRPLYVVRHSDPEPIFIELANIHNPEDRKRILFPSNRQLLADWITEGFLKKNN